MKKLELYDLVQSFINYDLGDINGYSKKELEDMLSNDEFIDSDDIPGHKG